MTQFTLAAILAAENGWNALAGMPKTPKVAYTLMKYFKRVYTPEVQLIVEYRNDLIKELVPEGAEGIEQGTPEFEAFGERFSQYLNTSIDLEPVDLTMDELVDAISATETNTITDGALMSVEPFFKDYEPVAIREDEKEAA